MQPCADQILRAKLERRARRLGLDREDRDDLVQETLLRLMQAEAQQPEHYAMVILHNLARARWRMRIDTEPFDEDCHAIDGIAELHLTCCEVCTAIDRLPPAQARILRLVLEGEESPAAIARRLALPVGTVMSRLARARAQLRADVGLRPGAHIEELL